MRLSEEQVRTFREDGVLVIENLLTSEDLSGVISEYEMWIDTKARQLKSEGKITDLCEKEPFESRFARLYAQSSEMARDMDLMNVRGREMFAFLHNPHLLDAVESLLGSEITCNPIQHIRAKPPSHSSNAGAGFYNVPWHQDAGVMWREADASDIITVWIALTDATVANGCMEVMPHVWKSGYLEHQAEGGTTIRPDLMPQTEAHAVPVSAGGVVFMHRHTPHRSTPNFTDEVRWSLDLRYQPTGVPTGRPFHPDFVVRSAAHPETVLDDHAEWSRRWQTALENSKGIKAHRTRE